MNHRFAFAQAPAARATAIGVLLFCGVWFSGCEEEDGSPFVPSLQPLYTEADLDFDARLIGKWTEKDGEVSFVFERSGEQGYKLTVVEKDGGKQESGKFDAHLVQLGREWFLDLYPEDLKDGSDFYQLHFLRAHTFIRVQIAGDDLTLCFLSDGRLKARINDKSLDTPHEIVDGSLLLTGTTQEIQDLVYRYSDDEKAFAFTLNLTRQRSQVEQ